MPFLWQEDLVLHMNTRDKLLASPMKIFVMPYDMQNPAYSSIPKIGKHGTQNLVLFQHSLYLKEFGTRELKKMAHSMENYPPVDSLLPHRDRMKLIDEIVELTAERAVTRSTVTSQWPLVREEKVDSLIIIELVAQTSAIHINRTRGDHGKEDSGGGLLVGVKEAEFFVEFLPQGTILTTSANNMYSLENYTVLEGLVCNEYGANVGRVEIQVIRF